MSEVELLDQFPELKLLLKLVSASEKIQLTKYIKTKYSKFKSSETPEPFTKQIVTGLNRGEISLSNGILVVGTTLALFQGQMTEFRILTSTKITKDNPGMYNLLALEALILKGDNYTAFSWISKSLQLLLKIKENNNLKETNPIHGEEIFTHILAYYCYYLMVWTKFAWKAALNAWRRLMFFVRNMD